MQKKIIHIRNKAMIATTILVIFAILYYLFCTFLYAEYVSEEIYTKKWPIRLLWLVCILIIAPIATPIMLGIYIGDKLGKE